MAMQVQCIKMAASAEEPVVAGSSMPVREVFDGGVVDPPSSLEGDERDHEGAFLGDEEDALSDEDFSSDDDEDDDDTTDDEGVDSDSEFEEDDDEVPKVNNGVVVTAAGMFLGEPARIATVQSTVSFTKIEVSCAPPSQCQDDGGGGEIIVQYRYTRFLRAQSGGDGVDMHILGPKQARLRFVLPSPLASDPVTTVTSLRFAGTALASMVYPARFSAQLQKLWSCSVTTGPAPVRVLPPRTTLLLVTVDVGILRPGNCTPARMRRMCAALESMARERAALPRPVVDVVAELQLPALLRSEDDVRPTKRRRVTGEDCPICCEVLQEGLAAWPRCSHIFHDGCLEQHLLMGYQECPLCRSELKLSPAPCRK